MSDKILYTKYNRTRDPRFQISTTIVERDGERRVIKRALTPEAVEHVVSMAAKATMLEGIYINTKPVGVTIVGNAAEFDFVKGQTASDIVMMEATVEARIAKIKEILDYTLQVSPNTTGANIDLILDNLILADGQWYMIDYEWAFDGEIPEGFVYFRAVYYFYHKLYEYWSRHFTLNQFLEEFGYSQETIDKFTALDDEFQQYSQGEGRKYIYFNQYRQKQHSVRGLLNKSVYIDDDLEQKEAEINTLYADYIGVINSRSWKITEPLRSAGRRARSIKKYGILGAVEYMCKGRGRGIDAYFESKSRRKVNMMEMPASELEAQRNHSFKKDIKFSVLVPLYNTPENFLREMIESVANQTYSNWELCLADGSDDKHSEVGQICEKYAGEDSRIKYKKLEENLGISGNTNACFELATGDYFALFDHDDLLHPSALYEYAKRIEETGAEQLYCDEATFEGRVENLVNTHYKSDFSWDYLRGNNYICHFSVFSRQLCERVGQFNSDFDGSQDYDMILRLAEQANRVEHIAKVLYFWRASANSTAKDMSSKTYALEAGRRAIEAHLQRVGLPAQVELGDYPGWYRVRYELWAQPKISIIIPNKDALEDLSKCINSILEKSTYSNYEIIIVENNSETKEIFDYYQSLEAQHSNIKVVRWKGIFNYSAINNFGFRAATGDYVLLLNNDIEIITPGWIEEMLMFAQRPEVGAVGAMLYYPDDTIQHAGVILGVGGVAGHSHKYFHKDNPGYFGRLIIPQNLSAVTAACMLIPREVFEKINGLDEAYQVAFNDVDLCLRIRESGYLITWTPHAKLYHYESKSRGYEDTPEKQRRFQGEINRFKARWGKVIEAGDPYYNPNLTLDREDFGAR